MVGSQMVKKRKKHNGRSINNKGHNDTGAKGKINASNPFYTCAERINPFGKPLGLMKFPDLVSFYEILANLCVAPRRKLKLSDYLMIVGILFLLFIGFNTLRHFTCIRLDALGFNFFRLTCFPVACTF